MKIFKKILSIAIAAALIIPIPQMTTAAVTTSESINTNELVEVENLVGHYQFNVAAGSNVNAKGDREYSHVDSMKTFEKNHSSKLLGNSSGGYLDGSYNEDGSIYKAYLVIETSTIDYSLPDYPITFVSGNTNNKMETKVEYYCFDKTYSSGNERRAGYIDVTDFVQKNGYGWYYVCNIPYSIDGTSLTSDQFAGWKLIVIEENYNVPMRMLKLKLGSQNVLGAGESSSISISGQGIKTTRTTDVTGQFLFGMAGADPSSIQGNSILYSCSNDEKDISYKTITTKSGVRTPVNPLTFISSRNGNPLDMEVKFDNPIYFDGTSYSETNVNGSYLAGAGDLELLDISSTSDFYHDVKLDKDKSLISFKFETVTDCALMTSVLGIAVDIDVPVYDNQCNISYNKDTNQFTVEGTFTNITDLYDIGVISPVFSFVYDDSLSVVDYNARITSLLQDDSAKYERKLTNSDIKLDKDNHSINFNIEGIISGNKKNDKNIKNDTFYYSITLVPERVKDYYDNSVFVSGTLYSSGTNTGLYLDKISAKTIRNTLDGVITKRSLSGKIIWNDNSDKNSYRPLKIEVALCMDSVPIDTIDVTGRGNIWEYSFDDLNIYKTLDYQYDYEALIKEEYEHYNVSYEDGNIVFNLEEKYVPENNIIKEIDEKTEKVVSDITLFNLDFSSISDVYGIYNDLALSYKNIIQNN